MAQEFRAITKDILDTIGFYDEVHKNQVYFVQNLYVYHAISSTSDFEIEANQDLLADAITDLYNLILKWEGLQVGLVEVLGE